MFKYNSMFFSQRLIFKDGPSEAREPYAVDSDVVKEGLLNGTYNAEDLLKMINAGELDVSDLEQVRNQLHEESKDADEEMKKLTIVIDLTIKEQSFELPYKFQNSPFENDQKNLQASSEYIDKVIEAFAIGVIDINYIKSLIVTFTERSEVSHKYKNGGADQSKACNLDILNFIFYRLDKFDVNSENKSKLDLLHKQLSELKQTEVKLEQGRIAERQSDRINGGHVHGWGEVSLEDDKTFNKLENASRANDYPAMIEALDKIWFAMDFRTESRSHLDNADWLLPYFEQILKNHPELIKNKIPEYLQYLPDAASNRPYNWRIELARLINQKFPLQSLMLEKLKALNANFDSDKSTSMIKYLNILLGAAEVIGLKIDTKAIAAAYTDSIKKGIQTFFKDGKFDESKANSLYSLIDPDRYELWAARVVPFVDNKFVELEYNRCLHAYMQSLSPRQRTIIGSDSNSQGYVNFAEKHSIKIKE